MPRLQEKAPRKVPKYSQKMPLQAAFVPITEPSVLTFSEGGKEASKTQSKYP
jgi:hypothetical protein